MRKVMILIPGTVGCFSHYDDKVLNSMRNLVSCKEHIENLGYLDAIDKKTHSWFVHRVSKLEKKFDLDIKKRNQTDFFQN